jgi:hypothetical protein
LRVPVNTAVADGVGVNDAVGVTVGVPVGVLVVDGVAVDVGDDVAVSGTWTTALLVAVLLVGFRSGLAELIVATLMSVVPPVTAALTVTAIVTDSSSPTP